MSLMLDGSIVEMIPNPMLIIGKNLVGNNWYLLIHLLDEYLEHKNWTLYRDDLNE